MSPWTSNTPSAKQLAWHTRRGIKEVEMLLIPFFEQHYNTLPQAQKEQFQNLLQCADTDIFGWLLQQNTPSPPGLQCIIQTILDHSHN